MSMARVVKHSMTFGRLVRRLKMIHLGVLLVRCLVATFFVCQAIADSLLHSFGKGRQNPETLHSDSVMRDMARTVQLIPWYRGYKASQTIARAGLWCSIPSLETF
ncbi:hypothetical protein FVEG_14943 [Fusarium verticillioides 7600]|uniref:Uncharacterized protein n=1 Tax=Gibberella moniliformis (strain M3125 / FGSC 7600) TaxID=334819 RepID=W7LH52_GIBM7|nr:hypothetical protein FVEG_14943 [Fusarium verticillioides 7600]XP_018744930.1 hypothetical protein FVEG_14943 [Fusarium verticillioides 7600]EWG38738.1 hypothetical protein FVEG_14943 [Fusarium verticillioides 7600]EWG38739.1 hypothetical protein FVEG_14943 [Fusarium verticillioides 7600]